MQNNDRRNYSIELQKLIDKQGTVKPKLLLHACCAPCSSYVLEYISKHFDITMLYYNPNITPESEYTKRLDELKRLLKTASFCEGVRLMNCKYDPESFFEIAKGLEELPEGNERCFKCYMLRLELTAQTAKENGFDYFTTTLSISPYKNSKKLAEISLVLEEKYGIKWLPSDFKKKGGYKRSIELSKEFDLYRQDYCGCVFSKLEAERKRMNNDSSTCE